MAVNNFTVKFSGTVAYTDNSHGSFESTATWMGALGGLVAANNTVSSQFHFAQLVADELAGLQAMLDVLGGAIILTPTPVTPDKTVNSFVAEISGSVSYSDGTKGLFLAQWVDGVVNIFPNDSLKHWLALADNPATNAFLITAFEKLAGAGEVVVSAVDGATSLVVDHNPTVPEAVLTWVDTDAELGYRVERREPSGVGSFTTLAILNPDVVTYTDDGTEFNNGTSYDYRVVAFSAGGDAPSSNVVVVTT